MDLKTREKCKLKEIAEITRAQAGKIYPEGTNWIELSATKGRVGITPQAGPIETRNAVIIPKIEIDTYYLHLILDRSLGKFLSRYLTTINLQADVVGLMEIEYHTDIATQKKMAESFRTIEEKIETKEKELEYIEAIKKTMLDGMMV